MKRNLFFIAAVFVAVIGILLLGNIITIGDKIGELTHVYVEYAFYAIIVILFLIYVIRPVVKVHRSPEFPVLTVGDDWDTRKLAAFAKKLAKNCDYIPDKTIRYEHQTCLMRNINIHIAKTDELRAIITNEIALRMEGNKEMNVLGINKRIKEWGKTVFMVTAVSQNSKMDALAVLVMNYKLIADIVRATGFRPTYPQLFGLYVKVLTTSLITYCTSQVFTDVDGVAPFDFGGGDDMADMDDIDVDVSGADFGSSVLNNLKKITIPGILVGAAVEGCINALMTLRIGYVTRTYLLEGSKALSGTKCKRKVKRQAIKDSIRTMPEIISEGSVVIGKTMADALKRAF